jgi:hypothetical protein
MGGAHHKHVKYVNFHFVEDSIKSEDAVIINTMSEELQNPLIWNTTRADDEEMVINSLIEKCKFNHLILIYGKNSTDTSVEDKYKQLKQLNFKHVYIYRGGMFEWLLLQEIYGKTKFSTTSDEINLLKYA